MPQKTQSFSVIKNFLSFTQLLLILNVSGKKLLNIGSLSQLKCGWESKWKHKLYFLFGIVIGWYDEQLDIIQAKIEHHKINKHHKQQ